MSEAINESRRSRGAGSLAFAAIPWVLALGFGAWVAVLESVQHDVQQSKIEARFDNRVGVNGELQAPVDVVIARQRGCLAAQRAYMDDSDYYGELRPRVTAYVHSACPQSLEFSQLRVNEIAPDGTIIHGHTDYFSLIDGNDPVQPNETSEMHVTLSGDRRVAKVVISLIPGRP